MTNNLRIVILVSFVGVIAFILTRPVANAVSSLQTTDESIAMIKQQNQSCITKLNAQGKMQTEQKSLEQQIGDLRAVVPKEPALDLLMLDLENMCHASHVDLVGVENLEPGAAAAQKDEVTERPALNMGNLLNPRMAGKGDSSAKAKAEANQTLLKQINKQVYVAGNYDGFVHLIRRLETYQRIIGLNNLSISVSSKDKETKTNLAAGKAEKLKIDQPVMSFVMTVYYLP